MPMAAVDQTPQGFGGCTFTIMRTADAHAAVDDLRKQITQDLDVVIALYQRAAGDVRQRTSALQQASELLARIALNRVKLRKLGVLP